MNHDSNWENLINKNFLKPDELASFLNISRLSLYRLTNKRKIPFYKVGRNLRFKREDIINYLKRSHFKSMVE